MKTRMTSFKKAKLNKSDGQTNIEKYRLQIRNYRISFDNKILIF